MASSVSTSALERLQLDIAARLTQLDALAGVYICTVRPRSEDEALLIQTDIEQALAGLRPRDGLSGAAAIILMPEGQVPEPDTPGPRLDLVATIRVAENPLVNMGAAGTGLSAEDIALEILSALHHWSTGTGGVLYADREALRPDDAAAENGQVVYEVRLRMPLGLSRRASVATPKITTSGSLPSVQVTLTCATSGAALYYSTDGSHPAPSADGSTLYTVPFTVAAAATVRAVGYLDDTLPSHVAQSAIS